jgi:hypothetical protein
VPDGMHWRPTNRGKREPHHPPCPAPPERAGRERIAPPIRAG